MRDSLAGINEKLKHDTNTLSELANNEIDELYPSALWIRAYTDGSSQIHCLNGGAGIYIEWPNGEILKRSIPTGKTSDSLKAEKEAIEEAVNLLSNSASNSNIVILTDAKKIIQSLQDPQNTQLTQLRTAFHKLNQNTKETVLQWIPGHAKIIGNEIADQMAKSGSSEL